MASKNLGAVIQRAISDGAFRRQLQSDPATALRGFNLTADEVAAIRSGDSGKLMSLGVDQRMSKAFTVGAAIAGGASRSSVSDGTVSGTSATIADGSLAGTREGIIGDPTSGSRSLLESDSAGNTREALSTGDTATTSDMRTSGDLSGTRAVHDNAPFDSGRLTVTDPTAAGTRAVHDDAPFAGGINAHAEGSLSGTRAVNDVAPFAGGINEAASSSMSTRAVHDVAPFEGTVASRMADANLAGATRSVNDVAPFDSGTNAVTSNEFIPTDELRAMEHNVGANPASTFVPSDSADVQREMLEGGDHGDALGNTGGGGGNTSS